MSAIVLPPAQPFDFSATGLQVSGRGLFKGLSVRETSGNTPARVDVFDGSANGRLLTTVALSPNESTRDWFAETGVSVEQGVFVVVASGSVVGTVYVIPENRFEGFSFPSVWAEGAQ